MEMEFVNFINIENKKYNFNYIIKLLDKIKSLEIKINNLQNELKIKDNIIKNLEKYKEEEIMFHRNYK